MKKSLIILMMLSLVVSTNGCFVHHHTIGAPSSNHTEVYHQWYALYGFFPLGEEKDGGALAASRNVKITTKYNWLDVIMNITLPGLMGLAITRRTIIIEK